MKRHTTQYFEMFGNRAIYHEGWFARTIHRAPWCISFSFAGCSAARFLVRLVGIDNQTPVAEGIGIGSETRFTGKIDKITLEVSPTK